MLRSIGPPFDEAKLILVRQFLWREFPDHDRRDYFDFANTAQIFILEFKGKRQLLVVPKETFDCLHFDRLLGRQLVAALTIAAANGRARVTLTRLGALPSR